MACFAQPKAAPLPRANRLLDLIQLLRTHRFPVSGAKLAENLGISLRTLYRDIASLQAQGAEIEGEAGVGFILKPGFMLPPLMFSEPEIEALVLGTQWVAQRTDPQLASAARSLLARIKAVLPAELRPATEMSALLVAPGKPALPDRVDLALVRKAIRMQRKARILYADAQGQETTRLIWPFVLGFFESARVVAAWCETRKDFRSFRCDRLLELDITEVPFPRRRQELVRQWRLREGIEG